MERARTVPSSTGLVTSVHLLVLVNTSESIRGVNRLGGRGGGWRRLSCNLGESVGQARGMLQDTGGGHRRGCQPDSIALGRKFKNYRFQWC